MTRHIGNRKVWLVDSTLRDGEQTAGVAFSRQQKIDIAKMLAEIGVPEIEVGNPAMGLEERETIRQIVALSLPCRLTAFCRATIEDLEDASACGVEAVHISVPTSNIQLRALGRNRTWAVDRIKRLATVAKKRFAFVSVGAQDASRADPSFLAKCGRAAMNVGVDRFRLADTVGVWEPLQTYAAVSALHSTLPNLKLGFHAHNDLGMATANTLAALSAGVDNLDVTVNGLGERAGNAALEEVVMAMRKSMSLACGVDARRLREVCALVAQASRVPIHPNKPITGRRVFCHESGVHVHGVLRDPATYEPFAPEEVGRDDRELVLGKHSGRSAVEHVLTHAGIEVDTEAASRVVEVLRHAPPPAYAGRRPD